MTSVNCHICLVTTCGLEAATEKSVYMVSL